MKKLGIKLTLLFIAVTTVFTSCNKSDNFESTLNDEIHLYIWRAMNTYYLWQENAADLNDTRFTTVGQVYEYYRDFQSPADMFQSLLYQPGVVDKFSVIVDDYVALENSFQGLSLSNGMEFGLVRYANDPTLVFGYVRYVLPGSDAETKGITRGMLFTEVDGVPLTDSNFGDLLFGQNTMYTIELADFNNGDPIANGTTFDLVKLQSQENPIHIATTITDGANKVGYLMYNQFNDTYDSQLNSTFAYFQSENITDLIIDLRYNGGGRTNSALWMGSMITGQFNGQLFSRERWNSKVLNAFDPSTFVNNFSDEITNRDQNGVIQLQETINSLNLSRVYFITTNRTASASELVMNSLAPYIDVYSIGSVTTGKVNGSITLYDSDNFTRTGDNLNPNHTWAIQPLVVEIVNANNENVPVGITPTVNLPEDYGNLGVLGERSDPLIDRAMLLITTGSRIATGPAVLPMEEIANSKSNSRAFTNMHTDIKPSSLKRNQK